MIVSLKAFDSIQGKFATVDQMENNLMVKINLETVSNHSRKMFHPAFKNCNWAVVSEILMFFKSYEFMKNLG